MKYNLRRQEEEGEEEGDSDSEIQQLKQKIRLRRQLIRRSRVPPCANSHSKATRVPSSCWIWLNGHAMPFPHEVFVTYGPSHFLILFEFRSFNKISVHSIHFTLTSTLVYPFFIQAALCVQLECVEQSSLFLLSFAQPVVSFSSSFSRPLHWQRRLQEELSGLLPGPLWLRLGWGGGGVRTTR